MLERAQPANRIVSRCLIVMLHSCSQHNSVKTSAGACFFRSVTGKLQYYCLRMNLLSDTVSYFCSLLIMLRHYAGLITKLHFCRVNPIMMRVYQKVLGPTRKSNYNPEYLLSAVKAVKSGKLSIRKASEQYAVPYTTLNDKLKEKYKYKIGGQPALSNSEEKSLVEGLLCCAKWGFPLRNNDVKDIVQAYLNRAGRIEKRFRDNRPGHEWVKCFLKRNKELTVRVSENVKRARAAVTRETVIDYFKNLEVTLSGVPPSNIINYDETNFCDDPGQVKVIVKRGSRHPERIVDSSKSSISVMIAAAADGSVLPPYTVYRAKHLYDTWTEGGITGAGYNRNQSGWFDLTMFESWFVEIVLPYFRKLDGPKVIIGDNLSSHLSYNVIKLCQEQNIKFVLLPPNSTHLCQPLDVAFFRPLKLAWRNVLDDWKRKNSGVVPKSEFPRLLKKTFENIAITSKTNVISGFRKAGIFPVCPDKVISQIPEATDSNAPGTSSSEVSWAAAFEMQLKQIRSNETKGKLRQPKRLALNPGKGIVISDFNENENDSHGEASRESLSGTSNSDIQQDESNVNEEMDQEKDTDCYEFKVNDFTIVKFPTKKRFRFFIGKIESVCNDTYEMTFLRKKVLDGNVYFVFPEIDDATEVERAQIIKKVLPQQGRRGKFIFQGIDNYDIE